MIFRSISANPGALVRDDEDDGKDGILRHLRSQFQSYSRLGDRRSDGSHITMGQSDKWLKQVQPKIFYVLDVSKENVQARIIDGRILSTVDTSILWKKLCKASIWMNFSNWLKYVQELSDTRGI